MSTVAVTIGGFDGVHTGHVALVLRARQEAGPSGRVVAMVLDPHPRGVLSPGASPARLTTFCRRRESLRAAGADEVVRLEPTPGFLAQQPEVFIQQVVDRWSPSAVVEGHDFCFGRGRSAGVSALRAFGASHGFRVTVVAPVCVGLRDGSFPRVSSTLVRELLARGRVQDAASALGRLYEVAGEVVQGAQRGREFGFPTSNVRPENAPPADGVYAALGVLPCGRSFPAAVSVGTNPTFPGPRVQNARTVEAYLSGWDGKGDAGADLAYGWSLRLSFAAWLRDQAAYGSKDALLAQIRRDVRRTEEIVAAHCAARPASEETEFAGP